MPAKQISLTADAALLIELVADETINLIFISHKIILQPSTNKKRKAIR